MKMGKLTMEEIAECSGHCSYGVVHPAARCPANKVTYSELKPKEYY